METLGIRKFWKSSAAGVDVGSDCDDVRNAALVTDDDGTDDEDSFFDLVIKPPGRSAVESPRDVFMSKNDVSNSRPNPKFKIFLLGFRKSSKTELKTSFTRDNTLRSKLLKESSDYEASSDVVSLRKSVPKYLKLIKPFYHVKASKKAKLTDSVTPSTSPVTAPVNFSPRRFSEGCRVASFKIVARNLGKSRSASAMIGVPPPLRRRDDSLLEQADGIQGAILHCKKSYESSSQEYSQLFRSSSDPSHKILRPLGRNSCEEPKRYSI